MMIDFPHADTVGQRYAAPNGVRYQWSGSFWFAVDDSVALVIGLLVDAAAVTVPAEVGLVCTTGHHRPGLGGGTYAETDALPPFGGGFATNAGTRFWRLISDEDYCITKFGADGDSSFATYLGFDNTPAINNAINYVASLPGGGTVTVPQSGIFACAIAGIPDPDGGLQAGALWMLGVADVTMEGKGGWIVRMASTDIAAQRFHLLRIEESERCKVLGVNFDGSDGFQQGKIGSHIIRVHDSKKVQISFNTLRNSIGYTISSDVDADDIAVTFNSIYESRADAIDFHNTGLMNEGAIVGFNVISGFGRDPSTKGAIHGRGHRLLITGNAISKCYGDPNTYGILAGNGEDESGQQITANNIEMGTECVNCKAIGTNNPNTIITDNYIVGDTGTLNAINISNIVPGATKGNTTVSGNVVVPAVGKTVSTAGSAIVIGASCVGVSVIGNVAHGSGASGIEDLGTGTKFTNNQANDNTQYGYDCRDSTGAILDFMNTGTGNGLGLLRRGTGTIYNQPTDLNSVPSFPSIIIRNPPVLGTDAINLAYLNTLLAGAFVPLQSGLASNVITGDALEHTFMIGTVPVSKLIAAGAMGLNGNLIIKAEGSNNSSPGLKTFRVRLGPTGTGGMTAMSFGNTTSVTCRLYCDIYNQNSLTSQKGWANNNPGFGASAATAPVTGLVNMNLDQPLYITGQLDNPLDQMWLDAFSMRLVVGGALPVLSEDEVLLQLDPLLWSPPELSPPS